MRMPGRLPGLRAPLGSPSLRTGLTPQVPKPRPAQVAFAHALNASMSKSGFIV
jgi:hypothetical protein